MPLMARQSQSAGHLQKWLRDTYRERTPMRVQQLDDRTPPELTRVEVPMRVREAAVFLGVSPRTVYLWVERKQIPHLRVMGRNIRFLKSDLEPFRAQFKHEVENGETK
jgi:excisionase family DNA binding protein